MPTAFDRGFTEGMPIGVVPVVDPSGTRHSLRFEDDPVTVLYILSPTCLWCARNEAAIRALAESRRHHYRFVGLFNTDTGFLQYASATPLPFPLYAIDSTSLRESADLALLEALGSTPQTVVIDGGKVRKVWVGAYGGSTKREIERFFEVSLPGLLEVRTGGPGRRLR
jgi:hypothetical protein